jgi:pimeloyl-ACP methyl ester carboxylesterase
VRHDAARVAEPDEALEYVALGFSGRSDIVNPARRTLLTTGAAAAALAAAPGAFAQQTRKGGAVMPFYQKGDVRIAYEEAGKGFPLLIISGGGLNSTIEWTKKSAPFNAMAEFSDEYRCIVTDLRNAHGGQSSGPLEVDRPWDSYTDDHLALMDHLGIQRFMVLGYCIGAPYIWNLVKRAPDRVVAAVPAQPVGWNKAQPTYMREASMKSWAPELMKRNPAITSDMIEKFLTRMFPNPDFLFTVNRDFVRSCQTPMLILLDDTPGHPYDVAWETAMLAPKSELAHYPWKDPKELIPIAVRQVRSFLRAHRPQ